MGWSGGKGKGWSKGKGWGKGGNGKGKGIWNLDDNQWPILPGQSASNQGLPQGHLGSLSAGYGSESWDSYCGDWGYYEDPESWWSEYYSMSSLALATGRKP